ncbi:MAG: hypothetical protein IJ087_13565 [Eggerthellaceae bacterium]|nr:hypothetical protein [Eggerthellaceae bacterium]
MWQTEKSEWLFAEDLQRKFRMGRSKSCLVLNRLPGVVRIGKRKAIRRSALELHLEQHGEIEIEWPRQRR